MDLRQVGQGFMSAKFSTNSANPDNCHLQMICRGYRGLNYRKNKNRFRSDYDK